jgi:hypothetical protein
MVSSWGPATDLETTCAAGLWPPTAVAIGGDTVDTASAVHLLQGTDIVLALRKMGLQISELAAITINVTGPETLLDKVDRCVHCTAPPSQYIGLLRLCATAKTSTYSLKT